MDNILIFSSIMAVWLAVAGLVLGSTSWLERAKNGSQKHEVHVVLMLAWPLTIALTVVAGPFVLLYLGCLHLPGAVKRYLQRRRQASFEAWDKEA